MKNFYRLSMLMVLLALVATKATSQAKLVVNGGIITINNGAALVINNPDNTAITYNGSGYIQSEGAGNRVIWIFGPGNGNTYLIPFGNAANYLPLQFNAASGIGANGQFVFSTYATPTWKNSDYLPLGITNVNSGGADNSAKLIDRFWQINPEGYSTKPTLTNLNFTYSDLEYAAPNTITEANLFAQRWNNSLQTWDDYIPTSSINSATNNINISSISGSQIYDWWTLVDRNSPLPITLVYFKAMVINRQVVTSWQTVFENNSSHFEVWRSQDGRQFENIGRIAAAGNSNTKLNYTLNDATPYPGISYYRLKSIDKDGTFTWSNIEKINLDGGTNIFLSPNPATSYIAINTGIQTLNKKPVARLYDTKGNLLKLFAITSTYQQVNITVLPAGIYNISISYNNQIQTLPFIKK
ncbi:T9SS type A sorting domain-containing protein [Flavitalea flava]